MSRALVTAWAPLAVDGAWPTPIEMRSRGPIVSGWPGVGMSSPTGSPPVGVYVIDAILLENEAW